MPTAITPTLSEDSIDDLLYLARTGATSELQTTLALLADTHKINPTTILSQATDTYTGNGLLHMASANNHIDTLKELLNLSPQLDLQNASGNTPLHWAALNGHLDVVKALVGAGADVTVLNKAGHDAVYSAEVNEKIQVVEWLLRDGKGLDKGVGRGKEEEEDVEDERETEASQKLNVTDGKDTGGVRQCD